MEAKEIKEFWWKPYIRKLFDKKVSSAFLCDQLQVACDLDCCLFPLMFWLKIQHYVVE